MGLDAKLAFLSTARSGRIPHYGRRSYSSRKVERWTDVYGIKRRTVEKVDRYLQSEAHE